MWLSPLKGRIGKRVKKSEKVVEVKREYYQTPLKLQFLSQPGGYKHEITGVPSLVARMQNIKRRRGIYYLCREGQVGMGGKRYHCSYCSGFKVRSVYLYDSNDMREFFFAPCFACRKADYSLFTTSYGISPRTQEGE